MKKVIYVKVIVLPDYHASSRLEINRIYKAVLSESRYNPYHISSEQLKDREARVYIAYPLKQDRWAEWEEVTEEDYCRQENTKGFTTISEK